MSAARRSRRLDRAIGIGLGVVLGLAVIAGFVFFGSDDTIDAPRISGVEPGKAPAAGRGSPRAAPTVRVIGGAPPPSGPPRLDFREGKQVRFRLVSDAPIGIAVPGYGIRESVPAGASIVSFRAARPGPFPVIVAASRIAIATLRISPRG